MQVSAVNPDYGQVVKRNARTALADHSIQSPNGVAQRFIRVHGLVRDIQLRNLRVRQQIANQDFHARCPAAKIPEKFPRLAVESIAKPGAEQLGVNLYAPQRFLNIVARRIRKLLQVLIRAPQFSFDAFLVLDLRRRADPLCDAALTVPHRNTANNEPAEAAVCPPQPRLNFVRFARRQAALPLLKQQSSIVGMYRRLDLKAIAAAAKIEPRIL